MLVKNNANRIVFLYAKVLEFGLHVLDYRVWLWI